MEKMNPEVKTLWLEALRSGRYQQGRGRLRTVDMVGENRYCCLGVLCDLYDKVHGEDGWVRVGDTIAVKHGARTSTPSAGVLAWAGLHDRHGEFGEEGESLVEVNDNSSDFAEVIEVIEEYF